MPYDVESAIDNFSKHALPIEVLCNARFLMGAWERPSCKFRALQIEMDKNHLDEITITFLILLSKDNPKSHGIPIKSYLVYIQKARPMHHHHHHHACRTSRCMRGRHARYYTINVPKHYTCAQWGGTLITVCLEMIIFIATLCAAGAASATVTSTHIHYFTCLNWRLCDVQSASWRIRFHLWISRGF